MRVRGCIIPGIHAYLLSRATKAADCPGEAISAVVATSTEAVELAEALGCSGQVHINVNWHGRVKLEHTLVLGNGSSLNITGSDEAIIDGADAIQLFTVNNGAMLSIRDATLQNGRSTAFAGGILAINSSLEIIDCSFMGNLGFYGGESHTRLQRMINVSSPIRV